MDLWAPWCALKQTRIPCIAQPGQSVHTIPVHLGFLSGLSSCEIPQLHVHHDSLSPESWDEHNEQQLELLGYESAQHHIHGHHHAT